MGTLFGTDGIRGKANQDPLTAPQAVRMGQVFGQWFQERQPGPVVIGQDSRRSGDMLVAALSAGISSVGVEVLQTGLAPTPAVAFLTRHQRAAGGVVVSASHNPAEDNGVKLFNAEGFKLTVTEEDALETRILTKETTAWAKPGRIHLQRDALDAYGLFLHNACDTVQAFNNLTLVLDCANGAVCGVAPMLFEKLGARVILLASQPNGDNINKGCGSEHPETLAAEVTRIGADAGLAFDGDGDRLVAVDPAGSLLSGDQILAILALAAKQSGHLNPACLVSTVMSNAGLGQTLKQWGIRHVQSGVGDRLVVEQMRREGAVIGGEDSGHVVLMAHHTTGDGLLTAIKLLEACHTLGSPLAELKNLMPVFPQVLINVPVSVKPDLSTVPTIAQEIKAVAAELADHGRVLVRYSGTQAICRVMVESQDRNITQAFAERLARVITAEIG